MLRTLVYLDADLASSIALRYTCQLARLVGMKLYSAHVEKPEQDGHAPGTGWVRRTWENTVLKTGEFEIAQLIQAERSSCPKIVAPKIFIGDRDNEILQEIQKESYDLFVEGSLHSFSDKRLYDKIHSRLYRLIPCPVIIVKNLVNIEKIALMVRDEMESKTLISTFLKIFKDSGLRFDVVYCKFQESEQPSLGDKKEIVAALSAAEKLLTENQCPPENCVTLQGTPEEIGDTLRTYGLVVCPLHHTISKKNSWFQLLSHVPSPILICWQ